VTQRRTSGLFFVLLFSLASAACSSGSKGSATGAAGTAGGAAGSSAAGAGAAGTPGDAAAGSVGSSGDAAADATGAAGATTDAGSSDVSLCLVPSSLGTVTLVTQSAAEGGDRSTVTMHDSVAWLGQVNSNTMPDVLDVQLYKSAAPFGATLASMSIPLTGQDNFATCGACVLFHPMDNDGAPLHAQTNYIAKSGTLNITAVPNGTATNLTASLSNVVFEHVTIDSSFATTKLDDCTITLTSVAIDAPVTPAP
jgi:hypothetical protein